MKIIRSLSLEDAHKALNAIRSALTERGSAAVIAVADVHGDLIALLRMDGAPASSVIIAGNKAFTAARERKATREIGEGVRNPTSGFDIAYYGDPRFVGWGGGLPVVVEGEVVGSVAVSGLPEAVDMELAMLGVDAILG